VYKTNEGEDIGKIRSYGGLTFLQVFEAGHMVPMDQPEKSLFMFNEFISGRMGSGKESSPDTLNQDGDESAGGVAEFMIE
jgi:carboxypeptidase C (cathepsin A)